LPRAWLCRESSRRQRLFAECPCWLSAKAVFAEGLALGKDGPSAKLPFPVVEVSNRSKRSAKLCHPAAAIVVSDLELWSRYQPKLWVKTWHHWLLTSPWSIRECITNLPDQCCCSSFRLLPLTSSSFIRKGMVMEQYQNRPSGGNLHPDALYSYSMMRTYWTEHIHACFTFHLFPS
jgi:hypothetical protein